MNMLQVNAQRNIKPSLLEKIKEVMNDEHSDMRGHMDNLLTSGSRSSSILELGVRDIQSTWAFIAGMAQESFCTTYLESPRKLKIQTSLRLVSIDIVSPPKDKLDEVYKIAEEHNINFEFHESDSVDITLENESFDTIFFDTDHTYEQLSKELKRWGNKSRHWLMFHDTSRFGKVLVPAINEFLEENPEWIIVPNRSTNECNGLVSLGRMTIDTWEFYTNQKYENWIGRRL